MYPRVRVKESQDPISQDVAAAAYLLRVIESISLEDNQPAKSTISNRLSKGNNNPSRSYTKNHNPNSKNQRSVSASTPKEKRIKGADEDNKNNFTAIPIPRPRAVLSSPDNDGIVGNQNKRIQERRRSAKGQLSDNNRTTNRLNSTTGKRSAFSTQCKYMKTETNNLHSDHRAERQPFKLNTRIQPNTFNHLGQPQMYRNTPPRANHIDNRQQSLANNQVFNGNSRYPKIKCSHSWEEHEKILV